MLPELGKIQFAYQMHGSVTAPTTEYDFGFFIVHGFLQVLERCRIFPALRSVGTPRVLCEYDFQPPGLQTFVGAFRKDLSILLEGERTMTRSPSCRYGGKIRLPIYIINLFWAKVHNSPQISQINTIFNRREGGYI